MELKYNKVAISGDGIYDYGWIHKGADTLEEIEATLTYTYSPPEWDSDTYFLANFNNTINAGNISSIDSDVLYWQVYRQKEGESVLHFVAKVPAQQFSLYDFGVKNNTTYKYILFAETDNRISSPFQQEGYVNTNWWNWALIGLEKSSTDEGLYYADDENIWLFDTEVTSGALEQNLDKYVINNFTRFPKISSGTKNYLTGTLSAYLSNPNYARYEDTIEQYNNFIDFIADENPKLLKDRKGNAWIVATTANNMQYIDKSSEQITNITFDFTQLNNLNDISIIGG